MSATKKKRPTPIMPTGGGYAISKTLGTVDGGYGSDELDNTMRQVQKMQTDKLKSTMIKKTQLEMEKDVKQLEKDVGSLGSGGGGSGMLTPEEMNYIMNFPEEQRGVAIQSMAAFRSGNKSDSTGSLGPLMIMSMLQKQPQAGVTELVTGLKGLNEIIQTGKPPQGMNDMTNMIALANLIASSKDTAYQTQIQMLNKQMEDLKPHDPLAYQKELISIAQGLGFQPGGGVNPEIERMKIENDRYLQKSEQEFTLLLKKMEKDDKRMEGLLNMLTDIAKPFAEKAGAALPGLFGGVAGASMVQVQHVAEQAGAPKSVKCPCGYEPIWVSVETPVVACPNCGQQVTHPDFKDKTGAQPPAPGSGMPPPPR